MPEAYDNRRYKEFACSSRPDPVDRMVRDCTAAEFTDWLVWAKSMPEECRENTESNLREQFKWHRLQGRLDHQSFLSLLAHLWGLRTKKSLERPKDDADR
jgi:hypothetical protein